MNTFITVTLVLLAIFAAIAVKTRKENNNKKTVKNDDNEFHLGEMTSNDIKPRFEKREKDYAKKYSQRLKEKENLEGQKK